MSYEITQKFISQNRSGKVLNPIGSVAHETADPGATDENEQKYFDSAYRGASAHAFVDCDSITQTIPWNEQAWHAGPVANRTRVGIELCHYDDAERFQQVWNRAVWLFAWVHVNIIKQTTITTDNLMSHAEVSNKWHETNHQDPVRYFAQFDKTVDDFRAAVQSEINSMIGQSRPQPQQTTDSIIYGTVTASSLNVRDGAGTNYNIIGNLKNGTKVRLGFKSGNWWNIYFGDHGGWISADYIKTEDPPVESKPQELYGIVHVNSTLNVRNGAGTNYSVIGSLNNGEKVHIDKLVGDWYSIYFGNHGGFVNKNYIRLV